MKLFTKKKNLLFLLALILALCLCRSEEIGYSEIDSEDIENISYLMKNDAISRGNGEYDDKEKYNIVEGEAYIKEESIHRPSNFEKLVAGYSYQVGDGEMSFQKRPKPDRFEVFHEGLIIYKDKEGDMITNQVLDVKNLGNKCGLPKMCALDEKLTFEEVKSEKVKSNYKKLLETVKPPTKCVGDTYILSETNVMILAFCFDSDENLNKFNKLLANKINSADFQKSNKEIKDTDSLEIFFSDGHEGLEMYKVKSTNEGLAKDSNPDEYLVFYRALEDLGGKKCNVLFNLPIVPIKFLDKNIFTPQCVLKIKYNKLDTYIGSADPDCPSIISDIKNKMIKKCEEVLNDNKVSQTNTPAKGIWTGWVYYLKKTQGQADIVTQEKALLKITPKSIDIEIAGKAEPINFPFLKWNCNNDSSCSLKEFFAFYEKTPKEKDFGTFDEIQKKILEEWDSKIPDAKSCLVSEFYDEIKIICPRDYAEEKNMKLALSVAIDMFLFDKPIDTFRASEDDVFKVLYSTEADKQFKEYSITIEKDGIKNDQAVVIIDYKKVQPIQNTVCGVEFRNIALPIFFSEVNPYCCAKILTDQNNFICTQQQSKCYIQLRQMILKYRKACLESQGVQVSATGKKIQANLEIVFAEIDNYKYRGEVNSHTGTLVLGKESVGFKKKTGEELYKFNYETLAFKCEKTHQPCTVKEFTENQDPFMNPDSDKVWFQSAIRNFFSKNSNIKEEDCMVVLSLDTKYDVFSIVLACTTTPDHGDLVRESLADFYKERVKSLTNESKELKNSPSALKNEEYDVKMIIKDSSLKAEETEPSKSVIKVATDGIIMKNSGDYLFKFDNLINYKKQIVNFKFKVNKSEIYADKYKIDENCCISAQTQSNKYIICLDSEKRCYYNKLIIYRLFDRKTEKKLKFEITRKNRMSQLYSQAEDPFDFGIKPKYKEFDSELNKLTIDTLDISTNGIWHGWVFYSPLTKRNYQHKVKPVWLEIEEGKISIKTDFNNVYPYKSLDLKEYDQICSGHCQPSEYIEKQFKNAEDYEDTVFLKKTIENVTAQLLVPFDEEACTILDFVNPVWGHGHSHIICAVDKLQGSQIRESINISYYDILLNLDIDTQVKMPYLETDQYDGVILINGEINTQYNKFYIDKEGLVGKNVSTEDEEDQKDVQPYKILYKDISGDNFGTECAFWYKNLRIKQRSDDINNAISDNNCCFRFFAGEEKKKIEICTFLKGGGICIKESRQLMKGIRSQCLNYVKNLAKVGPANEEVETMIDIYTEKTVDDSENGNFEGFVNIGSATKASQNLRQVPFFIKIRKNEINLYNDYTNTNKADVTIMTDNILFSCKDSVPCKPSSYRSYITKTTKNSILIDSIKTTYGLFKDTYGLNDESFENNCFVLEDGKSPYLVCSTNPTIVPSLKKSIIQAFNLNYSCKQITAPAAVEANMQYSVKIFREKNIISDKLELDAKGINMVSRKTHLFTYDKIDKDSVTGAKCAVWFKELPVTVNFPNPQCCFAISAKQMIYTICVEDGDMCIASAYKVIKTIWNRCMGQDGDFFVLPQSVDPEVLGQTNKWSPKIPFIPGKGKFDICPNSREVQIFDENKNLIQEFSIDNYNDIAFSEAKTLFKGWFKVYPLHNVLPNSSFLKLYGELSAENFIFYPSDTEKSTIKMSIRPDLLSMSCGFTEACKPFDFLDKVDEYGVEIQKEKYKSIIKTIEYGDDEGCAVLQRTEKGTPEFYVICVHIRKHKTTLKPLKELLASTNGYAASRNVIASFYGGILRKITYQSYVIARKFLDPNKFPNHEGPFRQLKYTKEEEKVEARAVTVDKVGAAANGAYILKYKDFKNCNIKVNIIYTPKELIYKDKQQCCLRYRTNTRREYICLFDMNCEAETLRLAHHLKTNCQKFVGKPGNIFNDLNSLPVVRIMPIIKTVFQATLSMSNPMELNPLVPNDPENPSKSKPISTQAFVTKNKTLAIKYLYMIKKIIHEINLSQPYDSGEYPESAENKDMYKPEFYGKNLEGELKLTVADQKRTYAGTDGLQLTILGDAYYIKHKEFQAVINPKISYSILKYKKDKVMKLLFIFDKKLMLATKSESAPKHVFLKEINDNIKETGLVLDSDDFKKIDKENPQKAINNEEAAIPMPAL